MDHNDDFELKPLTAGLGFQKRPVSLKEHIAKSDLAKQGLRSSLPATPPPEMLGETKGRSSKEIIDELHAALKPNKIRLTETLPRVSTEMPLVSNLEIPEISPLDRINFEIPREEISDLTSMRRGASDNMMRPLVPISGSFASIVLDSIVVFAFSLIFLVSLIMVTGVDLFSVLRSSQTEFATQLSLFALYLAVLQMYVIVSRSFFGSTVGEWTFELQLGKDDQIVQAKYPALVFWRAILNLATGMVVLPLLSLAFGTDLAAKFTGLQLYRKNY